VIAGLLIFGRIHYFRHDGACVVGLKKISSLSLLIYDLYINIFLTILFLWPLLSSKFLSPRVKRVATRTLLAAGVALTTSTINVVILTVLKGEELGWICLGSCGTDVLFNSFAIYWVTGGSAIAVKPSTATSIAGNSKGYPANRPDINEKKQVAFSPADASTSKTSQRTNVLQYPPTRGSVTFVRQKPTDAEDNTHSKGSILPSFLKSLKSMFWNKQSKGDGISSGIQITVTTEYEMDITPIVSPPDCASENVQNVGGDCQQVV